MGAGDLDDPPVKLLEDSEEWRRGWTVVLVTMVGMAIGTSHVYTGGIFVKPLQHDLGWSRAAIGSGLLIASVIGILYSPLVGWLIDRFGARRVGIPGVALYCAGTAMLALVTTSIWTWWGLWLLLSVGGGFVKPTLWATAISQRFTVQRGLALAIMLSGAGLGSAFLPITTMRLITAFGWRGAYAALGGGAAVIALPLLALFLRDVGPRGRLRTGDRPTLPGLTVRDGMFSSVFLRLCLATVLVTTAIAGMSFHFVPFLSSRGFSGDRAALVAGTMGVTSIVGRLITGALLDRWNGPLIGAVNFVLPAVTGAIWLAFKGDVASAILMSAMLGFSVGSEMDIVAYLSTRYFGLRNYGVLYGTIGGFLALGVGLGPTLAGLTYDETHSYSAFVWISIPAFLAAAVMVASLGRYPLFKMVDPTVVTAGAKGALPRRAGVNV